ncbi:DUF6262 family protein [Clostridium estertheticum]|uniref:DUF6262 family protein n=1 Tax=Clostridium estertheticum TaxID=238834 RepID=UPI00217E32E4|nr:DUF6262 family protein [Clostridium estertheticum]WLC90187.1 hypothetical protein KTC95_08390 [Clostridium estertheticum]
MLIGNGMTDKNYNFEYFMNRAYALNRDKVKCRCCGRWLYTGTLYTHRINQQLPINKINKVSNLASMDKGCFELVKNATANISNLETETRKKIESFRKHRNTEGLKEFAEKKNQETIEKVNKTIDKLKRSRTKKINFKIVAEEAGVSKATLYNNDILKECIMSLRAIEKGVFNGDIVTTPKDKIQAKDDKIKQLYEVIKKLKDDKQNLIVQLVEMEEIKDENKR